MLDTNVVLDWLVFRNPIAPLLEQALTSNGFRAIYTTAMRDELANVIARDALRRWHIDADAILATHDATATRVGTPPPLGATERLRCSDPDDQPFIDLAIAHRAHALLTRDRAVLRLASRARRLGVMFVTPEAWLQLRGSTATLTSPTTPRPAPSPSTVPPPRRP